MKIPETLIILVIEDNPGDQLIVNDLLDAAE